MNDTDSICLRALRALALAGYAFGFLSGLLIGITIGAMT